MLSILRQNSSLWRGHTHLIASSHAAAAVAEPLLAYDTMEIVPPSGDTSEPATVCFIHGLLGQGRNWRSFARRLLEPAAEKTNRPWQAILLDLRNHGASSTIPGFHAPHNLTHAAQDVVTLLEKVVKGPPDVLIGHSLGGKVVLELLRQCRDEGIMQAPKQAWVLDSDPGTLPSDAERDVDKVLHEVQNIPLPVPHRHWLTDYMKEKGYSAGLTQWLASNLVYRSNGYYWAFRLEGAAAMYNSYRVSNMWGVVSNPPEGCQLNMMVAEGSSKHNPEMLYQLEKAGQSAALQELSWQLHTLPEAGHWLHADNPAGLTKALLPSLIAAATGQDVSSDSSVDEPA